MYNTFIKPLLADVKTFVLDTLFPMHCLACGTEGVFICPPCQAQLKRIEHQHCIACQKQSVLGFTHPGCKTPHGADGLISLLNYHDDNVADIIIKGKYSSLPGVYEILGRMLARNLAANYKHLLTDAYCLTPVPLSARRLRWRGFNQAEILCRAISAELGLPVTDALVRTRATKTQKDLKREQRIKNVRDAFALAPNAGVHNQNFILVDDVTTTGSTVLEAAYVLKRNGANTVCCLTVARD